ncbi:MAG: hypothetical protein EPO24_15770 [Bacteroidetes bacterium]|nr:MAG: hypothetical protein EPO24_15770 [Bacteroidota bacterium]
MSDSLKQLLQSSVPDSGERFIIFAVGFFLLAILGMLVFSKMKDADHQLEKSNTQIPNNR